MDWATDVTYIYLNFTPTKQNRSTVTSPRIGGPPLNDIYRGDLRPRYKERGSGTQKDSHKHTNYIELARQLNTVRYSTVHLIMIDSLLTVGFYCTTNPFGVECYFRTQSIPDSPDAKEGRRGWER